jgi:hypothetical protein
MKWVLLATAPNQLTAEIWVEFLRGEGIPALIRASDAVSFLGVSPLSCRVLVPDDRLREARAVLAAKFEGDAPIQP